MIILAALVAASPALAPATARCQEPPTTLQASATAGTGTGINRGTFEAAGDIDTYRVQLQQGQDYAFGVLVEEGDGRWTVKGPTSTVLGDDVSGENEGWGFEFRAGRTGYYTIEGREIGSATYPVHYTFRLNKDCRDDAKTRCTIRPGAGRGNIFAHGNDVEWVKLTNVSAGRTYTATLTTGLEAGLTVRTSAGATVASGGKSLTFKAPAGTLFIVVARPDDPFTAGGSWDLALR
jgi:hypothetical protein